MKRITLIFLCLVAATLSIGCSCNDSSVQKTEAAATEDKPRLVVFGDSLSACYGCWPSMVAAARNLTLDNRAVGGTVIYNGDGQTGAMEHYTSKPGDVIVYLAGYNDMRGFGNYPGPLNAYRGYLKYDLDLLKKAGASKIIVMPVFKALCDSPASIERNAQACIAGTPEAYATIIREEAALAGVQLIDVQAKFTPTAPDFIDMVHLTADANARLAALILSEM